MGQAETLIIPSYGEIPDPVLPPEIPGLPIPPGQEPPPGGGGELPPVIPLPETEKKKKTDWLPWAILGAAALVAGAMVVRK
jgi:hypothetical protein